MKKTLALALAVIMICVCALTVSAAETTLPDVTFGGWWTAHSQGVQITEEGFTMTFTADTEDGAALNYCVPTLVIHAGSADAVGAEYWGQRADAWGWLYGENVGDHADALHAKGYSWNFTFEESFGSWENFQATTEAGTQATVTAKLEGSNVQLTYKLAGVINEVTIPVDVANPVYLCITGERCAVSNIVVTTPEEETQPTEPETQPTVPPVDEEPENITIAIGEKSFTTVDGKFLYNQDVTAATSTQYNMILIDKSFNGSFATNGYGVAIVLAKDGTLLRVYDGANVGFWTAEGKAASAHFGPNDYATTAFNELQENELLIVFTHTGSEGNVARQFGLDARHLIGQKATLTGFIWIEDEIVEPTEPETTAPAATETIKPTTPVNPGTGDNSPVMLAVGMMMAAACLIVLVQKKRAV